MEAKTPDLRGNLVNNRHKGETLIIDLREHGLGLIEIAHGGNRSRGSVQFAIRCDKRIRVDRGEVFAKREAAKSAEAARLAALESRNDQAEPGNAA